MGEIVEPSFDAWWKDLLDDFLEELLSLLAPEVHAAIDWRRGFESLDEEFQATHSARSFRGPPRTAPEEAPRPDVETGFDRTATRGRCRA